MLYFIKNSCFELLGFKDCFPDIRLVFAYQLIISPIKNFDPQASIVQVVTMKHSWQNEDNLANKSVLYFYYYTFPCEETGVLASLLIRQTFIVNLPRVDIDN